ncbi:hypothetical protein EMCG_03163 [[Emmonsia] crescens]|uniref:Uncharacterized protein n=1 Tax=[Emmonsia] crescens TaxID=73230 RepID=A0A0G2HWH8_9EURO|nr:hypothetical protein EMCG_03163 [Emmonsia crescens UAMH 3008]
MFCSINRWCYARAGRFYQAHAADGGKGNLCLINETLTDLRVKAASDNVHGVGALRNLGHLRAVIKGITLASSAFLGNSLDRATRHPCFDIWLVVLRTPSPCYWSHSSRRVLSASSASMSLRAYYTAGRSSGTQLSSISHLDRSNDQDVDAQRACCHRGELGGKGANRGCGSVEAFMCHCGFSAAARPSRGIRWAGPCSWEGGVTVERDRVEGGSFIEVESGGRPVHARCPIRAGAKPEARTPRLDYN